MGVMRLQAATWVNNNSLCRLAAGRSLQVSNSSVRHEICGRGSRGDEGWCHGWLVVVMEMVIMVQRSGGDKSVGRCCWCVFFLDGNDAPSNTRSARHRGFFSITKRTMQPADDSSPSTGLDSLFVGAPKNYLPKIC